MHNSPEHNFHPRYRPDIDGLRALAILPVVAFHAFPRYAPGGFIGVDIFFVISGYLISLIIFRSLARGDFSFAEFYAHRVRRIFPALIVVLAACYAIGWFVLLPDEFMLLGKHIAAGAGFVQNFALQGETGYFDVASELKPLLHLWSLAVEEQYYLGFPLFVWLFWRKGLNVLTGVALIAIVSFLLSRKGVHADMVKAFYWPQSRFWELMAGALLAYVEVFKAWPDLLTRFLHWAVFNRLIFRHIPESPHQPLILRNLAASFGLVLILASIATYNANMPWPGSRALAPVVGAVLLIAAGPQAWINRRFLAMKPLVWVGLISYPLYLWHWPLLSFLRIIESGLPAREWRIAAVALSFVLATLTYWLVERPVRYGTKRVWKNAAFCLALLVVGYVGFNAYERNGLEFRVKEAVRRNAMFSAKNTPWLPENQDERCKQGFPPRIDAGYCRLAKDGDPTVQLIGDSHAVSLYPGMRDILQTTPENVFQLGYGGCVPFFEVTSFDRNTDGPGHHHCRTITNQALSIAETSRTIHTVVLVSRGPLYLSGKGFFPDDYGDEKGHDRLLQSASHPELEDHYQIWETAMRETIDRLLAKGKRIVFVLDNPELGFDPKSCVDSRPWRLTSRVRQPCAVPRNDFDERNQRYQELVAAVLKDYPAVKVFDAAAQLCDKQWCWAISDGQMLYRDDDHLSLDGARLMARGLAKLLAIQ